MVRHDSDYYGLNLLKDSRMRNKLCEDESQYAHLVVSFEHDLITWYRLLRHLLFKIFKQLVHLFYNNCNKHMLRCEACELLKQLRSMYPFSAKKSLKLCNLIHSDVWGPTNNVCT